MLSCKKLITTKSPLLSFQPKRKFSNSFTSQITKAREYFRGYQEESFRDYMQTLEKEGKIKEVASLEGRKVSKRIMWKMIRNNIRTLLFLVGKLFILMIWQNKEVICLASLYFIL